MYLNIEEFRNDTDPNVWEIYLELYTSIELVWRMMLGTNYQIPCATVATRNALNNLGTLFVGDGTTNAVFDSTRGSEILQDNHCAIDVF